MQKLILFFVLFCSLGAQAKSVICDIATYKVVPSGLQEASLTISAPISTDAKELGCTSVAHGRAKLELCASEGDFINGYIVGTKITFPQGPEIDETVSHRYFGISRENKGLLAIGEPVNNVHSVVIDKLERLGISVPAVFGGDYVDVNVAIEQGYRKQAYKKGDLIMTTINNCRFAP